MPILCLDNQIIIVVPKLSCDWSHLVLYCRLSLTITAGDRTPEHEQLPALILDSCFQPTHRHIVVNSMAQSMRFHVIVQIYDNWFWKLSCACSSSLFVSQTQFLL